MSSIASANARQLGRPYSRASAYCTSRSPGCAGASGHAARSRVRASASPARSDFNQRLASLRRLSRELCAPSVRFMETSFRCRPESAEFRPEEVVTFYSQVGGRFLPCRGPEVPQDTLGTMLHTEALDVNE